MRAKSNGNWHKSFKVRKTQGRRGRRARGWDQEEWGRNPVEVRRKHPRFPRWARVRTGLATRSYPRVGPGKGRATVP